MADPLGRLLSGEETPRVLVVVAHPDDEVLGCGALLARLRAVRVVHVTDGAPRDPAHSRHHGFASPAEYAAERAREAEAALVLAGHPPACRHGLGVVDQEAPRHLAALARRLAPLLAGADLVLTHAYEGGHGDHDAVAFAVAAAARLVGAAAPAVVEMPFYRAGLPSDDPAAPGSEEARGGWVRGRFAPQAGAGPEHVLRLDEAACALKAGMLAAHRTQAETLRSFAVGVERFRLAPPHDFARTPHGGDLLYERHGWSLTWRSWLGHVAAAEADLARDAPR